MVLISHIRVKLFMRGLTSKLEACLSPCAWRVFYLRALLLLGNLEDLAEKTIYWETTRDDSLSYRLVRGGMHVVSNVSHLESKIAVLENMLKGLSVQ